VIDADGQDIGRIFKPRAGAPSDRPREWAITGAVVMPQSAFARLLCHQGRGQGEVRRDVARMAGK